MELLAFGDTGWGDELFIATLMTIAVSITAMIIGFFFALIFTPLKLSKNKFLNFIGNTYTTVIRGVPELLVIYLFFFGGTGAVMYVASIFGYNEYIEINAFITGAFAIGIISGAYSTEVFRGAVQSIDQFLDRDDLNHQVKFSGRHMAKESAELLKFFFQLRRC